MRDSQIGGLALLSEVGLVSTAAIEARAQELATAAGWVLAASVAMLGSIVALVALVLWRVGRALGALAGIARAMRSLAAGDRAAAAPPGHRRVAAEVADMLGLAGRLPRRPVRGRPPRRRGPRRAGG